MARIAGINIPQNKLVHIGLTYIYGIGDRFSKQICSQISFELKYNPSFALVHGIYFEHYQSDLLAAVVLMLHLFAL